MNGHPKFHEILHEMEELHDAKNADYAKGGDPLGNFHRVSAILAIYGYDIPPSLVATIYRLKQFDAEMWMRAQKYEGEVEGVQKRQRDEAVYTVLEEILYGEEQDTAEEEQGEEEDRNEAGPTDDFRPLSTTVGKRQEAEYKERKHKVTEMTPALGYCTSKERCPWRCDAGLLCCSPETYYCGYREEFHDITKG